MRFVNLALLLSLALSSASAQSDSAWRLPVSPSTRVRLHIDTGPASSGALGNVLDGRIVSVVGDSILVLTDRDGVTFNVLRAHVLRSDSMSGYSRRGGRGFAVGLGVGAALGATLGALSYEPCTEVGFLACFLAPNSRGEAAFLAGTALGIVGSLVGLVAGLITKTPHWNTFDFAAASGAPRIQLAPARDAFGIRGRIVF